MSQIVKGISHSDMAGIKSILTSTAFFYDFEVEVCLGIAGETLSRGSEESGYHWIKIMDGPTMVAFANYGKNDFSIHSWELYWIAVHDQYRDKKLGKTLLQAVEDDLRERGAGILWIETSGRPLYAPTEAFYRNNGYTLAASLADFYAPGDPKQVYSKKL